ncbi:MAG: MGMT family protein [Candidatus Azotimanducaceae bacterium WSBS_2022_MAG_OTU7]
MAESRENSQQRVWQIVHQIPKGKVASYGQIAKRVGMPSHSRLVGRILSGLPKYPVAMAPRGQFTGKNHPSGEDRQQSILEREGVDLINGQRQPEGLRLGRPLSPLVSG